MLGFVALVEALRLRDGWTGARLMPALVGLALVLLGVAHVTEPELPAAIVARWAALVEEAAKDPAFLERWRHGWASASKRIFQTRDRRRRIDDGGDTRLHSG